MPANDAATVPLTSCEMNIDSFVYQAIEKKARKNTVIFKCQYMARKLTTRNAEVAEQKLGREKAYTSSKTYVCLHQQVQPLTKSLHTPPLCNRAARSCTHHSLVVQRCGLELHSSTAHHLRPHQTFVTSCFGDSTATATVCSGKPVLTNSFTNSAEKNNDIAG